MATQIQGQNSKEFRNRMLIMIANRFMHDVLKILSSDQGYLFLHFIMPNA